MKNAIVNTIIPLILAITALLSAGIPYYNKAMAIKEEEKGQIVMKLLQSMDCTIKIAPKK